MSTASFGIASAQVILPKLALDFTTGLLDSRVTITRALNTATRFNSLGSLEIVNADLPRFDYIPKVGGSCKGILIEETRTNIFNTVNFVNPSSTTGWAKIGDAAATFSVVSDMTELANAGLSGICSSGNVFKLDNSAGTTNAYAYITTAVTFGLSNVSISAYVRGTGTYRFEINVGTWTGGNKTLSSVYERQTTVGATNTSSNQFRVRALPGTVIYFILAQLEIGDFSTSIIPNTGLPTTRNADVVAMTGTNFSNWYVPGAGAISVKFSTYYVTPSSAYVYTMGDSSDTETIYSVINSSSNCVCNIVSGSVQQASMSPSGTISANNSSKIAVAFTQDNFGASLNASNVVTDLLGSMPSPNRLTFGNRATSNRALNGWVQNFSYWPQRIINAEVQAFSK